MQVRLRDGGRRGGHGAPGRKATVNRHGDEVVGEAPRRAPHVQALGGLLPQLAPHVLPRPVGLVCQGLLCCPAQVDG